MQAHPPSDRITVMDELEKITFVKCYCKHIIMLTLKSNFLCVTGAPKEERLYNT